MIYIDLDNAEEEEKNYDSLLSSAAKNNNRFIFTFHDQEGIDRITSISDDLIQK
jgi:hypothetical protein